MARSGGAWPITEFVAGSSLSIYKRVPRGAMRVIQTNDARTAGVVDATPLVVAPPPSAVGAPPLPAPSCRQRLLSFHRLRHLPPLKSPIVRPCHRYCQSNLQQNPGGPLRPFPHSCNQMYSQAKSFQLLVRIVETLGSVHSSKDSSSPSVSSNHRMGTTAENYGGAQTSQCR